MKRIISILSVLAFILVFSSGAYAQNQSVTAKTEIQKPISTALTGEIDFGTISQGDTPSLDPSNTSNTIATTGSPNIAKIDIDATPSNTVTFSANATTDLNGPGGASDVITFTPSFTGGTADDQGNSSSLTFSSGSGSFTTGSDDGSGNNYYLYIGGSLSGTSSASGSYSNTFTVSFSYQ